MSWRPCDGIAGCEELDGHAAFADLGTIDAGEAYLQPILFAGDFAQIDAIATADGPAIAAWRYPRYDGQAVCMVNPIAMGGGRAAFGVFTLDSGKQPPVHRIYAGDLASVRDVETPLAVLEGETLGGGGAIQNLGVSSEMIVVVNGFGAVITDDGTRLLSPLPGFSRSGFAGPLTVVGRDAFYADWAGNGRAVHVSLQGEPELVVEVAGGDVRSFVTDGVDFVWRQTRPAAEGGFESCELWTAPYTNVVWALAPRKVEDMPDGECSGGVVGAGRYAYSRRVSDDPYRSEVILIRLSDGARSVLQFPPGHGADPIFISPTHIVSRRRRGEELGVYRSSLTSATVE
jgi:hypothetical protein